MAVPGNTNPNTGKIWRSAIKRALEAKSRADGIEAVDAVAQRLVDLALGGELGALKEIGDRLDGKAAQSIALTGEEGGPIRHSLEVEFVGKADEGQLP